jgi:hypothetical protein
VAKTAQGLKGKVLKKNFVLPIESWFFTFFQCFFLLMILHDGIFNLIAKNINAKFLIFFQIFL